MTTTCWVTCTLFLSITYWIGKRNKTKRKDPENSIPLNVMGLLEEAHRSSGYLCLQKSLEFLHREAQPLCQPTGRQKIGRFYQTSLINRNYPYSMAFDHGWEHQNATAKKKKVIWFPNQTASPLSGLQLWFSLFSCPSPTPSYSCSVSSCWGLSRTQKEDPEIQYKTKF